MSKVAMSKVAVYIAFVISTAWLLFGSLQLPQTGNHASHEATNDYRQDAPGAPMTAEGEQLSKDAEGEQLSKEEQSITGQGDLHRHETVARLMRPSQPVPGSSPGPSISHPPNFVRLLRARRDRPRRRCAAEQRDELAAPCMSGKQHSEGRRGFGHDRLPVA